MYGLENLTIEQIEKNKKFTDRKADGMKKLFEETPFSEDNMLRLKEDIEFWEYLSVVQGNEIKRKQGIEVEDPEPPYAVHPNSVVFKS